MLLLNFKVKKFNGPSTIDLDCIYVELNKLKTINLNGENVNYISTFKLIFFYKIYSITY